MTTNAIFQLVLYVVVLLALAKPLGAYMARVYEGRRLILDRALGWLERLIYRAGGIRPSEEMGWKGYALAMLAFNFLSLLAVYFLQRAQAGPAAEPAGHGGRLGRLVVQHRGELRHEHELAGLRRRDHDELPDPDARPDGAELRLRGVRDGDPGRADPRLRAPLGRDHRQLLGRSDPDDALHPAAAVRDPGAGPRVPGGGADVRRVSQGDGGPAERVRRAGGRQGRQARSRREGAAHDQEVEAHRAGHRGGPGRLPDRHQAARHQRGRLLQRQLGAPVREPDAAVELPGDAVDPPDREPPSATRSG